ncbi:CASC3 exon junction complex subunit isoform X2 [Musca autumnalis]|uniref:CASC3 exon junction complex subunit isoform X2 n=1 Tax=Musca autumnalis TaxID=221902 RepID=UPI003CF903CD
MADVENVSQAAAPATAAPVTVTNSSAPDAAGSLGTNGTSPTQEKSSNSHPHDSEYDTASDLEGGEEYDDDEDDLDDSLTDDDDDDEDDSETDDDDEDDDEGVEGDMTSQEKVDAEAQKKVDEDRSNPQYIPKRGTFYEHDDRTAEDGECIEVEGSEDADGQSTANGAGGSVSGSKTTPTISSASKTMKKWQPASAVDRWSHDRFDPSEQAPKSRTELVSAYGYDIRTEDAPPKARRRRRYGRGPSKYNRNWEDESAYLKTNNKERKPPKPSDFPALNENAGKSRRSSGRTREEKENRMERRQREGKSDRSERQGHSRSNHQDDYHDRRERSGDRGQHRSTKSKSNFNRQNQASVGRQAAMEFKQKNRQSNQNSSGSASQGGQGSSLSSRLEAHRQPNANQHQSQNINKSPSTGGGMGKSQQNQVSSPQQQQQHNDNFNKKKNYDQNHQSTQGSPAVSNQQQQLHHQQQQSSANHNVVRQQNAQQMQPKPQPTMPSTNLSQRLQQVQNRNDPSHVGSVQMHALASQNQQQQQQQQQLLQHQQTANIMMAAPQNINQTQEQRGPPKRYSSLRRSQHEAQHIGEHQQLQQLHMQQQQAATPPALLMPAEQAMLQANLIQMYHQENMQVQMQALQVSQQANVPKQAAYASAGPQAQPPGPYSGTPTTPTAYYVAPDAYTAASAAQATQAAATYAAQQPAPNYMAQQPTPATLAAYANAAPTPQQTVPTSAFGAAAGVGVVPQPNPAATAAANYQNYNTVGGTTYFVPPPTQTNNRPVSLPQRRPTNAIPILPPSDKNKPQPAAAQQKVHESKDETKSNSSNATASAPIGSAENIDHIIDNMFVQRPAFQPPANAAAASASNTKSMLNETTSLAENANTTNPVGASTQQPQQDGNTAPQPSEKLTNESATSSTEVSNNNPISTQE